MSTNDKVGATERVSAVLIRGDGRKTTIDDSSVWEKIKRWARRMGWKR